MKTLLIIAGDPSGDFHGANLVRALKAQDAALRVAAVGGSCLREAADDFIYDLAELGVTGFLEPVRRLPIFVRLIRSLKRFMTSQRPAAVICIDFYGFNHWVLEAAKKENIPSYYYISPQVWASRPGRARTLKRLVDRMLVIFPFEEEFYRKAGVPVSFVGHPLLDHMPVPPQKTGISHPLKLGLLPGSRPSEIRRHLPLFLKAADRIRQDFPQLEASIFGAPQIPDTSYEEAMRRGIQLVRETNYRFRMQQDLVLTSSGTATLENALLGLPMVVVYRLSWPTYAIARSLIRVPFISMANILAKKLLVPELIQHEATPERVSRAALNLLENPQRMASLRNELLALRQKLGSSGAETRAAEIILDGIRNNSSRDNSSQEGFSERSCESTKSERRRNGEPGFPLSSHPRGFLLSAGISLSPKRECGDR